MTECAADFVARDRVSLFGFVDGLHRFLRQHDVEIVVISGAPAEVLAAYREIFGWRAAFGVVIGERGGAYTGKLARNPAGAGEKKRLVRQVSAANALLAIGDSESDVPLFDAATCKIVVDSAGVIADAPNVVRVRSDMSTAEFLTSLTAVISVERAR
ncbi:hypothetical protein GCM10027436_21300 [Actinophytocola sediminis]